MKHVRIALVAAVLSLGGSSYPAWSADTGASTAAAPTTRPAVNLGPAIDSLADPDPAVRERAMKQIQDAGREALPALREHADSGNPEVRVRVRSLMRRAERRLPPAAPAKQPGFSRNSVSMSNANGKRTVDVNDNGYKIRIVQDAEGIALDVTGIEDGKEVTEKYSAKDADTLKKDNPEAFALYEKYNAGGPVGRIVFGRNGAQGNVQLRIEGGNAGGAVVPGDGPAQLEEMRMRIEAQLNDLPIEIPAEQRQHILDGLDPMKQQQIDVHERLKNELRKQHEKAADELKVPEREDPKPAPATQPAK